MALTFYHVTWCPECAAVREKLEELKVQHTEVIVPDFRPTRREVYEVSGQYYVPVIQDGETVLTDTRAILAYLDHRYGTDKGEATKEDGEGDAPCCSL